MAPGLTPLPGECTARVPHRPLFYPSAYGCYRRRWPDQVQAGCQPELAENRSLFWMRIGREWPNRAKSAFVSEISPSYPV